MGVIEAARELGKAIQSDGRYKRIMSAQKKNDGDQALQGVIGEFNLKRTQLNAEVQKPEKDTDRIKELDTELKELYRNIFENENMIEFTKAKSDMEGLISHINAIISGSASGKDPDTIDPLNEGCGGGCANCAGCG